MEEKERKARLILSSVKGVGPVALRSQLRRHGELKRMLGMTVKELDESGWGKRSKAIHRSIHEFNWEKYFSRMKELGIVYLHDEHQAFPQNLVHLSDTPLGMYFWGKAAEQWKSGIAIVGTRMPTGYGRTQARRFAQTFAQHGYQIISGLALGIDAEAHRATIETEGDTMAILGNGIDIVYPRENKDLFEQIKSRGGIWSEFPLGRRADRQSFPQRNRLVAAMSEAVVVIESGAKGGSLITARFAAELGKTVFVLPGRVDSEVSQGCHDLIRDGATLVNSPEDVLLELEQLPLNLKSNSKSQPNSNREASLQPFAQDLLEYIKGEGAVYPDALKEYFGCEITKVNEELLLLELKGLISKQLNGQIEAN